MVQRKIPYIIKKNITIESDLLDNKEARLDNSEKIIIFSFIEICTPSYLIHDIKRLLESFT